MTHIAGPSSPSFLSKSEKTGQAVQAVSAAKRKNAIAGTDARRIQHFHHRSITQTNSSRDVRHFDKARHLAFIQDARQRAFDFLNLNSLGRVVEQSPALMLPGEE